MLFDLHAPCNECPFRTDRPGFLNRAGASHIAHSLTFRERTFSCHKTVDYAAIEKEREERGEADEWFPQYRPTGKNERHCAGAMIMLIRSGYYTRPMQLAERLGLADLNSYDTSAPVFESPEQFIAHHGDSHDARSAGRDDNARV